MFCPSVGYLGGHFTTFFLLDRWSSGDVIVFYLQQGPQRWYFCCVLFFVSNIRLMSPSVGPLSHVVLETCTINTATVSKIIYVRPSMRFALYCGRNSYKTKAFVEEGFISCICRADHIINSYKDTTEVFNSPKQSTTIIKAHTTS